jgi:hypothetical protein
MLSSIIALAAVIALFLFLRNSGGAGGHGT